MNLPPPSSFGRSLSALVLAGALLVACHRHREPSADFSEASARFAQLYAQNLDEAFLDPQMAAIEKQLGRVPADSLDAEPAQALVKRIQEGRTRMQALEEERRKQRLAASAPTPNFAFAPAPTPPAPAPARTTAQDAGAPLGPTAGMSMKELLDRFGDCFEQGGPIQVPGSGMRDTWNLKDLMDCRTRYPAFVESFVVSDGASVMGIYAKSAIVRTPATDAGTP